MPTTEPEVANHQGAIKMLSRIMTRWSSPSSGALPPPRAEENRSLLSGRCSSSLWKMPRQPQLSPMVQGPHHLQQGQPVGGHTLHRAFPPRPRRNHPEGAFQKSARRRWEHSEPPVRRSPKGAGLRDNRSHTLRLLLLGCGTWQGIQTTWRDHPTSTVRHGKQLSRRAHQLLRR